MGFQEWKLRLLRSLRQLQRWRQQAKEQLVGLDLGPGFVRLLKIDSNGEAPWIEAFAVALLPAGAIVKDEIKDPAAVSQALQQVFLAARVKAKNVALAIPRSSTIIKTISVNKQLSSADIESRAWVEANHHFPDLVGDIYLDFDLLGPSTQDPSQLDLLLVACRKDQIKPYLDILEANQLTAKVVDVDCYALERALKLMTDNSPLKTVALLNLNFSVSSLIVIHEGQLIYAHDHSYEGLHFSKQAEQYIEAHQDQFKAANHSEAAYQDILKAGLSAHLRHSMHFFYSSRPHITIEKLVLSGDCATLPQVVDFIKSETGILTVLADPFAGMMLASGVDQVVLQEKAPSLMLCCGLALSRLKEMEL